MVGRPVRLGLGSSEEARAALPAALMIAGAMLALIFGLLWAGVGIDAPDPVSAETLNEARADPIDVFGPYTGGPPGSSSARGLSACDRASGILTMERGLHVPAAQARRAEYMMLRDCPREVR